MQDGVTNITFSLNFPSDANTKSREIIVRIDNSGNSSIINTLTFQGESWIWRINNPVSEIAAGASVELVIRNISDTLVKAYTDTEELPSAGGDGIGDWEIGNNFIIQ